VKRKLFCNKFSFHFKVQIKNQTNFLQIV